MISKGELVELGNHQQLLALNGVYAKLVRIQLGVHAETSQSGTESELTEQEEA